MKKTPEVIHRIETIMMHETAGDPISALKWTRRTTAKIAAELQSLGIQVSDRTVAGLLKQMGFSLRVNHKNLSGGSHPDRDAQFSKIAKLRVRCAARRLPVISVDTKKKELVSTFKNQGAKWDREPLLVTTKTSAPARRRSRRTLLCVRLAGQPWHTVRRHLLRHPRVRG